MTAVPIMALGRRVARLDLPLLVVAALVLALAGHLAWVVTADPTPLGRMLVADLTELPFSAGAALVAWLAASRTAGGVRQAWQLVAWAHLALFVGQAVWVMQLYAVGLAARVPTAELAYFIYYPLLLGGLLSFPAAFRSRADRFRFGLDAAIVVCAAATVIWYVSMRELALGRARPDAVFAASAYALGDLVLVVGITTLWLRRRTGPQGVVLTVLGAALFLGFGADLAYAATARNPLRGVGSVITPLMLLSYLGVTVAAMLQTRVRAPEAPDEPLPERNPSPLPYAATTAAYALLLVAALAHGTQPVTGLVVGALILTLLVLVRQLVAVRDNIRLTAEASARVSEARFRALVQHSSDVIAIVSAAWPNTVRTDGLT